MIIFHHLCWNAFSPLSSGSFAMVFLSNAPKTVTAMKFQKTEKIQSLNSGFLHIIMKYIESMRNHYYQTRKCSHFSTKFKAEIFWAHYFLKVNSHRASAATLALPLVLLLQLKYIVRLAIAVGKGGDRFPSVVMYLMVTLPLPLTLTLSV